VGDLKAMLGDIVVGLSEAGRAEGPLIQAILAQVRGECGRGVGVREGERTTESGGGLACQYDPWFIGTVCALSS